MLNRRSLLLQGGAASLSASGLPRPAAAAPSRIEFALPSGACDCHVHVFGDPALYPMAPDRVYTPPLASPAMLQGLQRTLGLDRVVLIQPSVYGADNRMMLDAMRQLGPGRARAVAAIGESATEAELDALRRAGVCGIRINLETDGIADPGVARIRFAAAISRCAPRGWHIQIYARLPVIANMARDLLRSPVPIVLDHFAGAHLTPDGPPPDLGGVLDLVKSGSAYVKISAPYRVSALGAPWADVRPLAQAFVAANPERVLWGSDWPHPDSTHPPGHTAADITPFLPIDDGLALNQLPSWILDEAIRRKILADNPARLYGF